eukprot:evm.model.scf_1664.2 EVM.evm.TU.scf_1664.2   scf_1664:24737-30361(+)
MADLWRSEEPLSNAEFRKLLETPLPRGHGSRHGERKHHKPKKAAPAEGERPRRRPPRPTAEGDKDKEKDEQAYRDRARERREGRNPDYEPFLPEMEAILRGKGLNNDLTKLTIEDSKFLGGDIEHTHLVKGLDYALLQKERAKVDREESDAGDRKKAPRAEDLQFKTTLGKNVCKAIFEPPRSCAKDFFQNRRTVFVYDPTDRDPASCRPTVLRRSKAECPEVTESMMGSMDANVLQMIAKIMSYMRPTIAGRPQKKLKQKEKLKILGILTKGSIKPATAALRQQISPNPKRAAPAQEPEPANDIFDDVGDDYVCSKSRKEENRELRNGKSSDQKRSYFGHSNSGDMDMPPPSMRSGSGGHRFHVKDDDDMELEDDGGQMPPPPPPLPPPLPKGATEYFGAGLQAQAGYDTYKRDEAGVGIDGLAATGAETQHQDASVAAAYRRDSRQAAQKKEGDDRERDPGFLPEHYAECYPGYHDSFAAEVVDSDDEDYGQMDTKGKGLSRYNFDTEEDWQRYKESLEAMPKAAFQYGVKMTDGRKTHKGLEAKRREQKMETQLQKIEKILKDQGHDTETSFRAAPQAEEETTPSVPRVKRLRV